MSAKSTSSVLLRTWRCPQCQARSFGTTARRQKVGPEHPSYIKVPEPPQPTLPYLPLVKGILPVPRQIFSGKKGEAKADDEFIAKAAPAPSRPRAAEPGSREEWRNKMAEARRRNLAEGLKGLRERKDTNDMRRLQKIEEFRAQQRERDELSRRRREQDQLTAPSIGLDLDKLLYGKLEDPDREARIGRMKDNVARVEAEKQATRMDDMHTLYMHARSFIVTPEQLDVAIDEAFGTPENPREFGEYGGMTMGSTEDTRNDSIWAYGAPMTVQDMLDKANRAGGKSAMDSLGGYGQINQERIRKIAEGLTGGKMDDPAR